MNKNDIKLGVSLYCYQDNYYFKRYDLEGCIAAAAGSGATGIEVFFETMMPEWPYISDRFVDHWHGLLQRYGVEAVCADHFSDTRMWKKKNLSDDQLYERGVLYIETAAKLGIPNVRMMHEEHGGSPPLHRGFRHLAAADGDYHLSNVDIIKRLLPVARDHNIMMCLETHAPTHIMDPCHQPYLEAAEQLGIPNVGLQIDCSSYEYCASTADIGMYVRQGANPEILNFIREKQIDAYKADIPFEMADIMPEIERMKPNAVDKEFIDMPYAWQKTRASFKDLEENASKVVYIHGKFYDILDDGEVDNIEYQKLFDALVKGGYKGYICSEFEGNRRMNDAGWVDEIEYVRKHQALMRKCLAAAK